MGYFSLGQFHGKGVLSIKADLKVEGQWINGKLTDGQGTWKDGTKLQANFNNAEISGPVTLSFKDGGSFKVICLGSTQLKGTCYLPNNSIVGVKDQSFTAIEQISPYYQSVANVDLVKPIQKEIPIASTPKDGPDYGLLKNYVYLSAENINSATEFMDILLYNSNFILYKTAEWYKSYGKKTWNLESQKKIYANEELRSKIDHNLSDIENKIKKVRWGVGLSGETLKMYETYQELMLANLNMMRSVVPAIDNTSKTQFKVTEKIFDVKLSSGVFNGISSGGIIESMSELTDFDKIHEQIKSNTKNIQILYNLLYPEIKRLAN